MLNFIFVRLVFMGSFWVGLMEYFEVKKNTVCGIADRRSKFLKCEFES